MDVILVRHGESNANVRGVWQGHHDSGLSPLGRQQATRFAKRVGATTDALVISSDLSRAADTARALGREVRVDPAWREANVGDWEGLTMAEVQVRFPEQMLALMQGEPVRLGGGESVSEFDARIEEALAAAIVSARAAGVERVFVFTHGGVIAGLVGRTLGHERAARQSITLGKVRNAAMTRLAIGGDGSRRLRVYNDTAHLGATIVGTTFVVDDTGSESAERLRDVVLAEEPATDPVRVRAETLHSFVGTTCLCSDSSARILVPAVGTQTIVSNRARRAPIAEAAPPNVATGSLAVESFASAHAPTT